MKKFILLTATVASVLGAQAQDFKTVLQKTFIAFDTTQDPQQKLDQANRIGLIAKKWDSEWAGHYYDAWSKAVLSYTEKDEKKKDAYLDEADQEREIVVKDLGKETDETYVLAAQIANARLAVSPMNRWQKYGPIFNENLEKAKAINADNPRIYFLTGMSKFHTPKMFGGGKKASLPYFEKAEPLFAKESKDDITKPYWGYRLNAYMLAQSKGDD
ncbi:MAG: hypothetical protein P4L41_11310 [Flavipsychrobacter sp.]|nr:hypothetical protein [Flavipsychrobacter sp.]